MHSPSCASAHWPVRGRKSTVNFARVLHRCFAQMRGAKMSEGTNLGAGNEEPDSATDETSPNETGAGDAKREKEGAPETETEAGVG